MFLSRKALQMDDAQCVKLFHVDGHFYKNQIQVWKKKEDENPDESQD